jgi:hypothetical protein
MAFRDTCRSALQRGGVHGSRQGEDEDEVPISRVRASTARHRLGMRPWLGRMQALRIRLETVFYPALCQHYGLVCRSFILQVVYRYFLPWIHSRSRSLGVSPLARVDMI